MSETSLLRHAFPLRSQIGCSISARIIETKTGPFDVSRYDDRYENALLDLVKAKQAGRAVEPAETPRPSNVVNLMDALRRSIASEKAEAAKRGAEAPICFSPSGPKSCRNWCIRACSTSCSGG